MHKTHPGDTHTLVSLLSDDHIVTASNQANIDEYYNMLESSYETKRLGRPTKYLRWHFSYAKNASIGISQPLLVAKLIDAMSIQAENPSPTPYIVDEGLHRPLPDEPPAPITANIFAEMVGYFRYLVDSTRPYICYLTSRLASANRNPTIRHFHFLKKVTRYLKGTPNLALVYIPGTGNEIKILRIYSPPTPDKPPPNTDNVLSISSNPDFANDIVDRT